MLKIQRKKISFFLSSSKTHKYYFIIFLRSSILELKFALMEAYLAGLFEDIQIAIKWGLFPLIVEGDSQLVISLDTKIYNGS